VKNREDNDVKSNFVVVVADFFFIQVARDRIRIENIRIQFKFIEFIQIHIHSNWGFSLFNSFELGFFGVNTIEYVCLFESNSYSFEFGPIHIHSNRDFLFFYSFELGFFCVN